jgi:hypothetical protein
MKEIATVGLDLAKNVFRVYAVCTAGAVIVRRQLWRSHLLLFFSRLHPCLIGMEACAGAYYWGRELAKFGHEVRLIPPSYVKPFVKRGKTDAADTEAICTAVTQPTMRFVPIKTEVQQAVLMCQRRGISLSASLPSWPTRSVRIGANLAWSCRRVSLTWTAFLPKLRQPICRLKPACRSISSLASSATRRRASTPSPPICAVPHRLMRLHAGCKRCRGSDRSRPACLPPRYRTCRPSARHETCRLGWV